MRHPLMPSLVGIAASLLFSCHSTFALPSSYALSDFETHFIEDLSKSYQLSNTSVKLVGYKKVQIPSNELSEFNSQYQKNLEAWQNLRSVYYEIGASVYRVYFPVEQGLIDHGGALFEANALGELNLQTVADNVAVVGRPQTEFVTGVEGNRVEGGIIYLATPNAPDHRIGNTFFYDFGFKSVLSHDHAKRDDKTSCMNNHGGPNCSDKFGIHNGRCPFRSNVCVDYNGYFTNCKKGDQVALNFPGSDCFDALAAGHCWNEIM